MSIPRNAMMLFFPFTWRGPLALAVFLGAMLVPSAHADSVTGKNSHNGVLLVGSTRVAFESATMVRDSVGDGPILAHPSLGPAAEVVHMGVVMPDPPITPGDEARINFLNRWEFGTPFGSLPDDRWTFRIEGTAGAVDAQLGGEPADAIVSALARAQFFVDPITAPGGTTIGQIVLDAIRPLTAKEADLGASIYVALLENGIPVLELGAGASTIGYPLTVGNGYEILATYDLHVPAGMDPPFLIELGATITPEPATFGLTFFALLGTACFARRGRGTNDGACTADAEMRQLS